MTQYALYKRNYDYIGSHESPEYERSGNQTLIKVSDDKNSLLQEMIRLERGSELVFSSRAEWYDLSQQELQEFEKFLDLFVDNPSDFFSANSDGGKSLNVWMLDNHEFFSQLNDEQFMQLLAFVGGGMYECQPYVERYKQDVVYTKADGYVKKDPHGYSDDFYSCRNLEDFIELVDEYEQCWGIELIENSTELTASDLSCSKFWQLVDDYADEVVVTTKDNDSAGTLTFNSTYSYEHNYQCMQDFSNVIDNPVFVLHKATNADIMQIEENRFRCLEKYKHIGRKA